jgi:hypothetical protein
MQFANKCCRTAATVPELQRNKHLKLPVLTVHSTYRMGSKGVVGTVVQRDGYLQVVQFVAGGTWGTVQLSVLVWPMVKLAELPCVKMDQWCD